MIILGTIIYMKILTYQIKPDIPNDTICYHCNKNYSNLLWKKIIYIKQIHLKNIKLKHKLHFHSLIINNCIINLPVLCSLNCHTSKSSDFYFLLILFSLFFFFKSASCLFFKKFQPDWIWQKKTKQIKRDPAFKLNELLVDDCHEKRLRWMQLQVFALLLRAV